MKWNSVKSASELPDIGADIEFITTDGQLREVTIHHENGCFKVISPNTYSGNVQVLVPSIGDKAKRYKVTAETKSGRQINNTQYFEDRYAAQELVRSLESDGLVAKQEEVEVLIAEDGQVVGNEAPSTDDIPF